MARRSLGPVAAFTSHASEWLVLLYLLLGATPAIIFQHASLTCIPDLNLLDGSWVLDTSYKASGGIWFGRDVAFTYGPLFQWLSSAPSRWVGVSTGAICATSYLLPLYVVILATFLTVRLLLPEAAAWRRALLVLLAVVYWSPQDVRVSFGLLAFAVFVRLTDAAADEGIAIFLQAFVAAVICATAFLISADTGLYSVAALLLCMAARAVGQRTSREMLQFLLAAVVCFGGLVLAINSVMLSPLDFKFWKSSLAIATAYRWFEPLPMSRADKHMVLAVLGLGLAIFLVASVWRRSRKNWTARPVFLLAGFCTALIMTQSALVRSDPGHVMIGLYPMIFFCGVIVLDRFELGPLAEGLSAAVLVLATLVWTHPYFQFRPTEVAKEVRHFRRPQLACPPDSQLLDGACLSPGQAHRLSTVSGFIDAQAKPGEPIAIFPYQTAFGLLSRHQVAGGVLQSYLVNGEYLSRLELQGLQRAKPEFALYLADGAASPSVDYVPTLTRSPKVWFYYLQHYRQAGAPDQNTIGLRRDDSRDGRIRFTAQSIANPPAAVRVQKRSTTIDLGKVNWPEGGDFLKLRLRVDYPLWWRVRKPSRYTLQMSFADGSQESIRLVVPPDRDSDVWVYPWDQEDLAGYFGEEEAQWRSGNRPALASLELFVTPCDWISVVPKTVAVESIEAVRLDLQ